MTHEIDTKAIYNVNGEFYVHAVAAGASRGTAIHIFDKVEKIKGAWTIVPDQQKTFKVGNWLQPTGESLP